jgi:hypothetical protein
MYLISPTRRSLMQWQSLAEVQFGFRPFEDVGWDVRRDETGQGSGPGVMGRY